MKKGQNTPSDTKTVQKTAKKKTRKSADNGKNSIAALDIGSNKVCCFIAEVKNHGGLEVIGIGHQASRGVRAGTVNVPVCQ